MGCGNLTKKSVIRSIHVLHKMKGRNWVQILGIYLKRKRFHVVFMVKNVTQGYIYPFMCMEVILLRWSYVFTCITHV